LRLENVLVALSDRLIEGDVGLMNSRSVSDTRIELRHATVLAQGGLVRLSNDGTSAAGTSGSTAMRVRIDCFESILAGGNASAMIEQFGSETHQRLSGQLIWNGDRSFYDGFAPLWRIVGTGPEQVYNFRQWQDHLSVQDIQTKASSGYPNFPVPPEVPLHDITASDFYLYNDSPAVDSASKGGDAGAVLHELPAPPPAGE
jgi:hypothetical protein